MYEDYIFSFCIGFLTSRLLWCISCIFWWQRSRRIKGDYIMALNYELIILDEVKMCNEDYIHRLINVVSYTGIVNHYVKV